MNFILTTFGSAGDVFPMLGLAIQLKQRGHRVTLVTNGYFAPLAEKHGIEFESLGTPQQYLDCIQDPDLWNPRKAFGYIFGVFQPYLRRQHEWIVEQAALQPTTVVASCLCFGARMAQETHGIPVLTLHLQPSVIWSDIAPPQFANMFGPRWLKRWMFRLGERFVIDPVVCPFLNDWRAEYGLPPVRHLVRWWNSPTGVLCLFPDWFAAPQADWPGPLLQTGFPLWNDDSQFPLPEDVQRFLDAGDPPIVFTPGTANVHGREFFQTAVEACQTLQCRGILLTRHPEQLPPFLPDCVQHFSYVPLDLLLARSAAFVHHGGIGSTSQALLAGIPQLIRPLAHDQFDNAERVKRLNAGASLAVNAFSAGNLARTLQSLLASKTVAAACRQIQSRLHGPSGLVPAADAIRDRFCPEAASAVPVKK